MSEPYLKGQFDIVPKIFKKYNLPKPTWLIIGGVGDSDEAQAARRKWFAIKIIGLEPSRELRRWQKENNFPAVKSELLAYALGSNNTALEITFFKDHPRNSSADKDYILNLSDKEVVVDTVPTTTVDQLNMEYGPINKAILWLSVEGLELECLKGAHQLLFNQAAILVAVDLHRYSKEKREEIDNLLNKYEYKGVHDWSKHDNTDISRSRIYIQKEYIDAFDKAERARRFREEQEAKRAKNRISDTSTE